MINHPTPTQTNRPRTPPPHPTRNGYAFRNGIHHLVLPSILEAPPERDAYATVDVLPDALIVRGHDTCMSLVLRYADATRQAPVAPPHPLSALAPWAAAAAAAAAAGRQEGCGAEARLLEGAAGGGEARVAVAAAAQA
jgi:hypothetical protein